MTNEQHRFLKARLEEANRLQRYDHKDDKEPVWVKEAERKIDRWRSEQRRKRDKHYASVSKRYSTAKTALLFSDGKKALAAVEKFEAGK